MKKELSEMLDAFDEIQQPRTPYMLEKMIVGSKFTEEQRYAQCVLELSIAYDNLRLAELHIEQKEIEIKEIKTKGRKGQIEKEIKRIEQEQTRRAMLGASREFSCLYELWQSFPKQYTREELNNAQPLEFKRRLELQALMDKNATGRVSQGNQEGLRQIGAMPFPELDYVREIDQRFLQEGDVKLSIVVPTEFKAEKGLPCIEGLSFPAGVQVRIENCYGLPVADAYNKLFQTALDARSDYVLTVEDDTFPQSDALVKLYELARVNPNCAVGAWYPKKEKARQGVHIIMKDGKRQFLDDKVAGLYEVYTLSMGCTLYPIEMFKSIAYPWFKTTADLSQDSFFSQLAREAGYKLLVDTSIKCEHRDRVTGEVFGSRDIVPMQVKEELDKLLEYIKGKKLILEVGTAQGGTLKAMMAVADDNAEFVSIDLPGGNFGGEFGQPEEKTMTSWLKPNQKLHIIRGDSKSQRVINAVKSLLNERKFDFIFIDGDHSYEGVKADYENYKKFAKKEIAFHDIAHHNREDVGVERLWKELKGDKIEYIKDKKQGWAGIGILKIK